MNTAAYSFAQAQNETDLPEDAICELSAVDIVKGSDPFDSLTPAEPFWKAPRRATLDENMTLNAILMKWDIGSVGSYEAFKAMEANGLINWDQLLWMISVQHRTGKIIEGDA